MLIGLIINEDFECGIEGPCPERNRCGELGTMCEFPGVINRIYLVVPAFLGDPSVEARKAFGTERW